MDKKKKKPKTLYGIEEEESLQSVDFATTENVYLNQQYKDDEKKDGNIPE